MSKICYRTLLTLALAFPLSIPIFAHPGSGIAVDRLGNVYFLDTGSGLWKIDTQGKLTQLSGTKYHWLALDANNGFANGRLPADPGSDWDIMKVGTSPTVILASDWPIAIGKDGNLYYPSGRPGHLQIMRTIPSGGSSVLATPPVTVKGNPLPHINGITAGTDGSLYYTEDNAIRRIGAQGQISTVATIPPLVHGPSIPGTDLHPFLRGLNVDTNGVMYVADAGDARVLKITPEGKITTLIQLPQGPWAPTAVALHGEILYVLEFLHTPNDDRRAWLPRVRKISSDGKSSIVATVDQMPGAR